MARKKPGKIPRSDTYAVRLELSGVPIATLWRRDHDMPTRRDKAAGQEYLTPQEENALFKYALLAADNGYHLPVRALRSLAQVIDRQRSSIFQEPAADEAVKPPGTNWPIRRKIRLPNALCYLRRTESCSIRT